MVKAALRIALPLLLVSALALGGLWWAGGTSSGARWVLENLARWQGATFQIEKVEGRLLGELSLQGVELSMAQRSMEAREVELRWSPDALLLRRLEVHLLSASGLRLRLPAQSEPAAGGADGAVSLAWPSPPAALRDWTLLLEQLRIDGLSLNRAGEPPFHLVRLEGGAFWDGSSLELTGVRAESSAGTGGAELRLGLLDPALEGTLFFDTPGQVGSFDRVELELRTLGPLTAKGVGGEFTLSASGAESARAAGELRLQERELSLILEELELPWIRGEVRAEARLVPFGAAPRWWLKIRTRSLDLQPLSGFPTAIEGQTLLQGGLDHYGGNFELENARDGAEALSLSGRIRGELEGLTLSELSGRWMENPLSGDLSMGWKPHYEADAGLSLQLAQPPSPLLEGLRLKLTGTLQVPPERGVESSSRLALFHREGEIGEAELHSSGGSLELRKLQLEHQGVRLKAAGNYPGSLSYELAVSRLSQLWPGLSGGGKSHGVLELGEDPSGSVHLVAEELAWKEWRVERATLDLAGRPGEHQLELSLRKSGESVMLKARGGLNGQRWRGTVTGLRGDGPVLGSWTLEKPVSLALSPRALHLGGLELSGSSGWHLRASAGIQPKPSTGAVALNWQGLNPAYVGVWKGGAELQGESSGEVRLFWGPEKGAALEAGLSLTGLLSLPRKELDIENAAATLRWNREGLAASLDASLDDGSRWELGLTADSAPEAGFPAEGKGTLEFSRLDLHVFDTWLPPDLILEGTLSGKGAVGWQDGRMNSSGSARFDAASLDWRGVRQELRARFQGVRLGWQWQQEALQLTSELLLEEAGDAEAQVSLPIPARWPLRWEKRGELAGKVQISLPQLGHFPSFFPATVQDVRGALTLQGTLSGTPETPRVEGAFTLKDGGAYLPLAGLQLSEISLRGRVTPEAAVLDALSLRSGPGTLSGSGEAALGPGGTLGAYSFRLVGEEVEVLHLPDLQIHASPELTFSGNPDLLRVRGTVRIPYALFQSSKDRSMVTVSPDQVLMEETEPSRPRLPFGLDARVELIAGERLLVQAEGLEARLGGRLTLLAQSLEDIRAEGRIEVLEGVYAGHGVRLKVERGMLHFGGGPISRPNLDVVAVRNVGSVKAGVQVTGTPRFPHIELYSEPPMPETDILSYMVLGRPLAPQGEQASLLMIAAGGLLSRADSVLLQDRLQRTLGIDVLDIQTGDGGAADSVVTIGKYLRPNLYISLGHSLFTQTNEFTLRYDFARNWELESTMGAQSGVDLYYRIEFE